MRRVVVLGGRGFFGGAAVRLLRGVGIDAQTGGRTGGDVRVDAEDPASLRRALLPGDVVLDAAGPFQARTTALVEAAADVGFDVVDLADAGRYVATVQALAERVEAAGVRVLPACSSVSAVSAALVARSGVPAPVRVTGFLVPTPRHTAVRATAASLLASLGRPVTVLRDGAPAEDAGFGRARRLAAGTPLGARRGWLFDSPDPLTLPRRWPSLRTVEWYVDANVPGLNALLALAARSRPLRRIAGAAGTRMLPLVRWMGGGAGGVACEVESADGAVVRLALAAREDAYLAAVAPAVLAVRALAEDRFDGRGVVPPDRQVDADALLAYLARLGIALTVS